LVEEPTGLVTGRWSLENSLTRAVCHEIPLAAGTVPIRGLEKEKEVSRQVRDLLDRGLIEPAHSAWSSPVVLVRKKDSS